MESMEIQDIPIEELIAERTPESELEVIDIKEYEHLEIIKVPISDLRIHPMNIMLHGDNPRIDDLLISIPEHGLKTPLLINPDREIIDGRRRYKALRKLRYESVPCAIDPELSDPVKALMGVLIADQQKEKTPEYIYVASRLMKEIESERAIQRMSMGGKGSPPADEYIGRTDDRIASFFNIGRTKFRQIEDLYDKADKHPKIIEKLESGEYSVNKAHEEITGIQKKKGDKTRKLEEKRQALMNVIDSIRPLKNLERKDAQGQPLIDMLIDKYSIAHNIRNTTPEELRHEIFTLLGRPRNTADETYKVVREYFEYAISMTKLLGVETITIPHTRYIDSTERHGVRCLNIIMYFPFGRAEMKQEQIPIIDVAYLRQVIREGAIVQGIVMINSIPHHIVWTPRFPRPPSIDDDGNPIPEIIIPEPPPLE